MFPFKRDPFSFRNSVNQEHKRRKRSPEHYYEDDPIEEPPEESLEALSASELSEGLLTESLSHRKIRNVMEKIRVLQKDDQVVAGILEQFCEIPPDIEPTLGKLVDLVHELEAKTTAAPHQVLPPAVLEGHEQRQTTFRHANSVCHSQGIQLFMFMFLILRTIVKISLDSLLVLKLLLCFLF